MFSATMTQDVDLLINDFFNNPKKISIAISGTPLKNISQQSYLIPNFYTKINLFLFQKHIHLNLIQFMVRAGLVNGKLKVNLKNQLYLYLIIMVKIFINSKKVN